MSCEKMGNDVKEKFNVGFKISNGIVGWVLNHLDFSFQKDGCGANVF